MQCSAVAVQWNIFSVGICKNVFPIERKNVISISSIIRNEVVFLWVWRAIVLMKICLWNNMHGKNWEFLGFFANRWRTMKNSWKVMRFLRVLLSRSTKRQLKCSYNNLKHILLAYKITAPPTITIQNNWNEMYHLFRLDVEQPFHLYGFTHSADGAT